MRRVLFAGNESGQRREGDDSGGVFVLINQGTPATAIAAEAATPTA